MENVQIILTVILILIIKMIKNRSGIRSLLPESEIGSWGDLKIPAPTDYIR